MVDDSESGRGQFVGEEEVRMETLRGFASRV